MSDLKIRVVGVSVRLLALVTLFVSGPDNWELKECLQTVWIILHLERLRGTYRYRDSIFPCVTVFTW